MPLDLRVPNLRFVGSPMARKKQKPDLRRIRPTKTYTIDQLANVVGKSAATLRRWIRAGLPVLDDARPTLIDGAEAKAWLRIWLERRKHACQLDQLYCCRCRRPRHPRPGSVLIAGNNEKTLTVKAVCADCGAGMRKLGSLAKQAEIETAFSSFTQGKPDLYRYDNPNGSCTSQPDTPTVDQSTGGQPSQGNLFNTLQGSKPLTDQTSETRAADIIGVPCDE